MLLNRILSDSVNKGASALYLTVGNKPMMRLGGGISELEKESIINIDTMNAVMNSFIAGWEVDLLKKDREAVLVKDFSGNSRFKINVFFQKGLPVLSFRHIPSTIKPLAGLGLPEQAAGLAGADSGLVVVAGPFGSGKTTVCASIIERVNSEQAKFIVTLEDPCEFQFVNKKSIVNQRQLGRDVNDLAEGLDFCLRESVDLLYIGESGAGLDGSIDRIFTLAGGNTLVLMEMNANDSVSVIEALAAAGGRAKTEEAARYHLAEVLSAIMVLNLLPRRGGGSVPAAEILYANHPVRTLIREGKFAQIPGVIQTSRSEGMITLEDSVRALVDEGLIKEED